LRVGASANVSCNDAPAGNSACRVGFAAIGLPSQCRGGFPFMPEAPTPFYKPFHDACLWLEHPTKETAGERKETPCYPIRQ